MNREILFRGKRLDNGEWVTGRLITDDRDGKEFIVCSIGYHWEEDNGSTNRCMECFGFEVDPETVGQYTGKVVKTGKLFQDDIGKNIDGQFLVIWDEEKAAFAMHFYDYWQAVLYLDEMWEDTEIIGNIHDNPELLEVLGDGQKGKV